MQKNMLITGVYGKIGATISSFFREKGYYVFGLDKHDNFQYTCDRFIQFDINQFVTDASYRVRFTSIFDQVIAKLHILINNAAVQKLDSLEDIKLQDWQESLNVNMTGPMVLSKISAWISWARSTAAVSVVK